VFFFFLMVQTYLFMVQIVEGHSYLIYIINMYGHPA